METYKNFAKVYDLFMQETPYISICDYIEDIWRKYGIEPKLVLDLGCGTGSVSTILSQKGYDVTGVDFSAEMLAIATEKSQSLGLDILYLNQDMREFELYGTVDSIVCLCDCINYITEPNELLNVFKLVNNYLNPGGLFIFDINTVYKFENILADNNFSETTEDAAYIWENCYDEESEINEYYTNFFVKTDNGLYNRFEEFHYQKAYRLDTLQKLLEMSKLKLVAMYDDLSFDKPNEASERVFFVVQEDCK